MKILKYEIGKEPYEKDINNELADLQKEVDGYIECVPLGHKMTLVCNEEGKIRGLAPNRVCRMLNDVICGNFFVVGETTDDFKSISDKQIELAKGLFK